jgi:trehalose utilization protein
MPHSSRPLSVLIWDEASPHVPRAIYPEGLNGAIAMGLTELGGELIAAKTANLDDAAQGISDEALAETDVILWWGHARHAEVADETAIKVIEAIKQGVGFIALHSAHYSKVFRGLLHCTGDLKGGWRETINPADHEEITVCAPKHPIAQGIEDFVLPTEEMYGAPFDVPPYEVLVFQSHFPLGGEYFPSFCTTVGLGINPLFTSGGNNSGGQGKGAGRVFYFRPGHESYPTYFDANVKKILYNAVQWAARRR